MKAPSNTWRGFVLLITLVTIGTMFGLTGCVAYKHGEVYFGAVGTDADKVTIPNELEIVAMNNSKAFDRAAKMVEKMWSAYLTLQGFQFVTGRYYDHEGKIVDSATSVKLEELRNAASEAEAAGKLKELQLLTAAEGGA